MKTFLQNELSSFEFCCFHQALLIRCLKNAHRKIVDGTTLHVYKGLTFVHECIHKCTIMSSTVGFLLSGLIACTHLWKACSFPFPANSSTHAKEIYCHLTAGIIKHPSNAPIISFENLDRCFVESYPITNISLGPKKKILPSFY